MFVPWLPLGIGGSPDRLYATDSGTKIVELEDVALDAGHPGDQPPYLSDIKPNAHGEALIKQKPQGLDPRHSLDPVLAFGRVTWKDDPAHGVRPVQGRITGIHRRGQIPDDLTVQAPVYRLIID